MNFRKLYVTVLLLTGITLAAAAQTDTVGINTIITRTAKLAASHPIEKVYLNTDKPYYTVGDTIWFKAYVTADIHQPSTISKVVYVDVITSKDSIVQSMKVQIGAGSVGFGNIALTEPQYKQDNYHLRAYTNWMRNDDPAYFFNKTIAVGALNKQMISTVAFSGSATDKSAKVSAKVAFKNPAGVPYANKKVSWQVGNFDNTLAKGKNTTNANGVLDINFTTNKPEELATSTLTAEIAVADGKTFTVNFPTNHAVNQPDIQFFPEGGQMLNGVRGRVAVKAIRPNGLSVDIKGTIVDNTGATAAEFVSQHLGMGVFALQPEAGKTYKANITFPDGAQASYPLPMAHDDGMSVAVYNTDPANLTVKLSATPSFIQKNLNKTFYLVGTAGEYICSALKVPIKETSSSQAVAKTKFPSGVIKYTLFDDRGNPISERTSFVMRDDMMNIAVKSNKTTYTQREKVTMNIGASVAGKPSEADLSVAVIDDAKVPFDENAETNILTSLLLTSELKGYIEKPNYYFNHPNDKTAADLDVLMLTQGYSRFSFKDVVAGKYPAVSFLPEQGITISGTIRNNTGLPISRGNVSMIIGDRRTVNTVADASGQFKFTNLNFPDSTKLVINGKNNPNPNFLLIMLDNATFQKPTVNTDEGSSIANIDSALTPLLQNSQKIADGSHVLKAVEIKDTRAPQRPSHTDYPSLSGLSMSADHTMDGSFFNTCAFIADCLRGSILGVSYDQDNLYITREYNKTSGAPKLPMSIYYNGMQVDFTYLENIKSEDIASIEVFENDGLSSINKTTNTLGVLVINGKPAPKHAKFTADQLRDLFKPEGSQAKIIFKGYMQPRLFYTPKYNPADLVITGKDLRSTVYWAPKVVTDKAGNTSVEFTNSDSRGSFRAIVEGIDANGNIGRTVYHYNVQ